MSKWLIAIGLALIIGSQTYQNHVQHQYMEKQQELVKAQAELIKDLKNSNDSGDILLKQQSEILQRIIKLYVKE